MSTELQPRGELPGPARPRAAVAKVAKRGSTACRGGTDLMWHALPSQGGTGPSCHALPSKVVTT